MENAVLGVGAVVVLLAVAQCVTTLLEALSLARTGVRTQGTLVDARWSQRGLGRGRYLPVVELTTQQGAVVRAAVRTGNGIGERVPHPPKTVDVLYDPARPERAVTSYNRSAWPGALVTALPVLGSLALLGLFAVRAGVVPTPTVAGDISTGTVVLTLLGLCFAVVGGVVAVAGLRGRREEKRILETGPRVPGVVTGVHWIRNGDEPIRVPVVAFRTEDGVEMSSWPNGGVTSATFLPGTPVTVVYDPQDPRTIYTDANGSHRGTSFISVLVGSVFAVVGVGLLAFAVAAWLG